MNSSPRRGLKGRVAVVTGAARGIGRAVAQRLLDEGVSVAALDSEAESLDAFSWPDDSARLSVFPCDVRCRRHVERVVSQVAAQLGAPTLLVNVAGVLRLGNAVDPDDESWNECIAVNCRGVVNMCQTVVPHMLRERAGAIVTVSSNAATTPRTNFAAYCASKAAATAYTRCLGLELAAHGIRCNVVSPGTTRTDMLASLFASPQALEQAIHGDLAQFRCGIPLRRIALPDDVAKTVVFLLSDDASHVTLHDLRVDGGATLGVG